MRDSYKDVDLYDVVAICVAYCSKKGDPDYNPNLDINCNGHIGLYDVVIACTHYGEKSESSTVSCRNNDLEFSMTLESTRIHIGDTVNITLAIKNVSNETLNVWFGSGQSFDLYLCSGTSTIARWADDRYFVQWVWDLEFKIGETYTEILQWNFYIYDANTGYSPPQPGKYELLAICTGKIDNSTVNMIPVMQIELYP